MEKEGDALVDPLANYWGLSLFTSPSLLPPSQPYNSDLDLQTIHTHLKSMVSTYHNPFFLFYRFNLIKFRLALIVALPSISCYCVCTGLAESRETGAGGQVCFG